MDPSGTKASKSISQENFLKLYKWNIKNGKTIKTYLKKQLMQSDDLQLALSQMLSLYPLAHL
jgi:hypothetical protein